MHATGPAKDFATTATAAASVMKDKSPIPILSNLLFTVCECSISFTGHNLDACTVARCEADVTGLEAPGTGYAVDGRIAGLLKSFPPEAPVKLSVTDGICTLQCGRARYRLDTLDPVDFPPMLSVDSDAVELAVSDDDRHRLLHDPAFAISDEKTRYYLCGLNLQSNGRHVVACGTDGHKLIKTRIASNVELLNVIVPELACKTIAKMDGAVIKISKQLIEARTGNCTFVSKLIEATFPDYQLVIPAPSDNSMECDRLELVAALHRLQCVSSREKNFLSVVQLQWADDALSLSLTRQEGVAADVLTCKTGAPGTTTVSVNAFAGLLGAIDSENVVLDTAEPLSPIRITKPGDDDHLAIIMPCRP
jgi:DNA polymerase III subunit beta